MDPDDEDQESRYYLDSWVSFQGERFPPWSPRRRRHYTKISWSVGRAIMREVYGKNGIAVWKEGAEIAWDDFKYRYGRELRCGCVKWGPFWASFRLNCPQDHGGLKAMFGDGTESP